jgi:hypothetical protein
VGRSSTPRASIVQVRDLTDWIWPAAVAALVIAMAAIEWTAARQESQTYDEAAHMAAGYSYLRNGEYHVDPEHPPLSKLLAAAPFLAMCPDLPAEQPEWNEDHRYLGAVFLYRNRLPAETLLMASRATRIAITLALGLALAVWTRRRFGAGASLLALFLFALDPNILAHGRYVTNDMLMALATFLTLAAWSRFLARRTTGSLCLAGAALGVALISKFSALFLAPVLAVLYGIEWWQRGGLGWRHALRQAAVMAAIAVGTIGLAYLPETVRYLSHLSSAPQLTDRFQPETAMGRALQATGKALRLPAFTWLVGLESNERHDRNGHPAYLLGETRQMGGWWYYFPVAFALKAPDALLLGIAATLLLAVRWLARPGWAQRLRAAPMEWYVLLVPTAVYGGLALRSHINIGVRHLLPVWPLLLVAVSAALAQASRRRGWRVLIAVMIAIHAAEAVAIYPHHLSFFNAIAGGPARGHEYLLDSNLDWGQDLKFLSRWQQQHGNPPVCLAYFGTADAAYYGVPHNGIPYTWETEKRASLDCIGAISATLLHDLYLEPGAYRWLREMRPVGRAGYSILLYDLRRRPSR